MVGDVLKERVKADFSKILRDDRKNDKKIIEEIKMDRIERLEARIRRLEADLEELKRLKKENEILRFNIRSLLNYIEEIKKG
ncbi:MAG: hypothetical protein ACXQTR_00960 [Candidatus Methanospirareceae archaeon]